MQSVGLEIQPVASMDYLYQERELSDRERLDLEQLYASPMARKAFARMLNEEATVAGEASEHGADAEHEDGAHEEHNKAIDILMFLFLCCFLG